MAGLLIHKADNYNRREVVAALVVAVAYGASAGLLIGFLLSKF